MIGDYWLAILENVNIDGVTSDCKLSSQQTKQLKKLKQSPSNKELYPSEYCTKWKDPHRIKMGILSFSIRR